MLAGAAVIVHEWSGLGPIPLDATRDHAMRVTAQDGTLLRAYTASDDRWRLPLDLRPVVDLALDRTDGARFGPLARAVSAQYLTFLLSYEDRRFFSHPGVDPLAVVRALWLGIRHGRFVSGASTLTMQVARLLDRHHARTLRGKLRQMLRAVQIEAQFSKVEILRIYLQLAPFGGNLEGVRAASLAYFGKEPRHLSPAQAALLVALPQAPETRRPDRDARAARAGRDGVLARVHRAGLITDAQLHAALAELVPTRRRPMPILAAHMADRVAGRVHGRVRGRVEAAPATAATGQRRALHRVMRLTIDAGLQESAEALVRQAARAAGPRHSAAALVVDHRTGAVRAHVGSADYLDHARRGSIDMTQAVRSPGSTLKPIIYGLAFEQGVAHPQTRIVDGPVRFGGYAPKNFNRSWAGTVTVAQALQASLNTPAVKLLHAIGPARLVGRLRDTGLRPRLPEGARPSLAMALGGLGMTLEDLALAYAHLARPPDARWPEPGLHVLSAPDARLGSRQQWHQDQAHREMPPEGNAAPVMLEARARAATTTILRASQRPGVAAGLTAGTGADGQTRRLGKIAYKTGTSYGHRDAWAVGYDGAHVVAVWVGRADGAGDGRITGFASAAPTLFAIFQRISPRRAPFPKALRAQPRVPLEDLPAAMRRFAGDGTDGGSAGRSSAGPRIAFPRARMTLAVAPEAGERNAGAGDGRAGPMAPVLLRASRGALPLTWLANGRKINAPPHRREALWRPDGPGFATLTVIDQDGRMDEIGVRVVVGD